MPDSMTARSASTAFDRATRASRWRHLRRSARPLRPPPRGGGDRRGIRRIACPHAGRPSVGTGDV